MGRRPPVAAVMLTLLLAVGCSSGDGDSSPSHSNSSSDRPSKTPSTAPNNDGDVSKALRLPNKPDFLIKVRTRGGSESLPDFTPSTEVYTVHVKCSGTETLKIVNRDNPKDDPTTVRCDSPVTVGNIYADRVKQKLAISAKDSARWTLAIVNGKSAL